MFFLIGNPGYSLNEFDHLALIYVRVVLMCLLPQMHIYMCGIGRVNPYAAGG